MINVGIVGLGSMGMTHVEIYARHPDAKIVAISDRDADRLAGKSQREGNIEGQGGGQPIDLSQVKRYADASDLIADPDVELVDLCLPTPLHRRFAEAAFAANKHVLIEKPIGRTTEDARAIVEAAKQAKGLSMVAMCMRFWPGWDWLKEAIEKQTYGKVLAAHFHRTTTPPTGAFYEDGEACGGAVLDLHIHDTDFVQHCFGTPQAVFSQGYTRKSGYPDHVLTHYLYDGGPMVTAEGGWAMAGGYGFTMRYTVNFEQATAVFDLAADPVLTLVQDGHRKPIELAEGLGYEYEIAYMLECIKAGRPPQTVTLEDAAKSVAIVEAEVRSIASRQPEAVTLG